MSCRAKNEAMQRNWTVVYGTEVETKKNPSDDPEGFGSGAS